MLIAIFLIFPSVKPYFTMEPEDATVQSGESVRFVCEVAGDPEPVVVSNLELDIRVSIKLEDPTAKLCEHHFLFCYIL